LPAFNVFSGLSPFVSLSAFGAFSTDFFDLVSPFSYLDFFDFGYFGGLSFYFYFDFDLDFYFLSLIFLFKL
jgi:hypothetical protein